jgi:ParB/RepB/Spo0J family partition protein
MSTEVETKKEVAELPGLGTIALINQNSTKTGEIKKIALNKIVVRDGFNVRQDLGNLDELAQSILENGQSVPGRVDILEDGTFSLVDGHRRYNAMLLLEEQGHEPMFLAIVNGTRTTEEQRIIQMFTTQDNKPLESHEVAELILRLVNIGHDQKSVAQKIGKTVAYVSNMLSYATESPVVKELVKKGKVKLTTVTKVKKLVKNEKERTAMIVDAVDKNTTGKAVTTEGITGISDKKIKAVVDKLITLYEIDPSEKDTIVQILKNDLR